MKTFNRIALSLVALLALTAPMYGQAALSSTTTAAAVTDRSGTTVFLTSVSGLSGFNASSNPFLLYVDHEAMNVIAVNTTTAAVTVARGMQGTPSETHASGATVYLGSPTYFATNDLYGTCSRAAELNLPRINVLTGRIRDCFGSTWVYNDNYPVYTYTLAPGAQPSAGTPTAGNALIETAQGGGAQSATTGNGAAGGAITSTGGAGGAGGTSSGTGGAGGAVNLIGGAGAGTITGGAGGAATLGAGAGANGTSAGGSGGALALYSGAVGTGGTGTNGGITIKQGGASGTAAFTVSTAGKLTLASTVSGQNIEVTPSGSGLIALTNNAAALVLPTSAGGIALGNFCGATTGATTCANTATAGTAHIVAGVATLASNGAALTGFSPAFTSSATWSCVANDITTRANPVQMIPQSGTAATITNTTGASDVINYVCFGY